MKWNRVIAVASKEWREILRDRIYFALAFLLPPMMMLLFGYATTRDVENVPFAIMDYDHSAMSRDYAQHYIGSRYFHFEGYLRHESDADSLLAHGDIRAVLIIPEHFEERLTAGHSTTVQTILDGTFTAPIRTIRGYIDAINSAASGEIQADYIAHRAGVSRAQASTMMQPVSFEVRYLYNEAVLNMWAVAPSLLMIIGMWAIPMLMAISVVRDKETGAIFNIYSATITRAEYLAGKLLPNVLIGLFNMCLLWMMAVYYFGAPFRGSIPLFLCFTLLFVICICGLGLLVSLWVSTQSAALLVAVILGSVIARQYSGVDTPIADMTGANYYIAHLFPAMYYTSAIENSFLKAGGLQTLWRDLAALILCSIVILQLDHFLFHKRTAV